jgi:hypothetical protein
MLACCCVVPPSIVILQVSVMGPGMAYPVNGAYPANGAYMYTVSSGAVMPVMLAHSFARAFWKLNLN